MLHQVRKREADIGNEVVVEVDGNGGKVDEEVVIGTWRSPCRGILLSEINELREDEFARSSQAADQDAAGAI